MTEEMYAPTQSRLSRWFGQNAAIVAGIYAVCAVAWIFLSDDVVSLLFSDPRAIQFASTVKGVAFIGVTAWLAYVLLSRSEQRRQVATDSLSETRHAWEQSMDAFPMNVVTTDQSGAIMRMNRFGLATMGYKQADVLGRSILEIAVEDDRPVVQRAMARARNGEFVQSEARFRYADGSTVPYRFQASAITDGAGRTVGLVGAGIDISDQVRSAKRLGESFDGLQNLLEQTIGAVSKLIEKRDPYTAGHQERVTELAIRIARRMGLGEEAIKGLRFASLCHDIGKINVPSEILSKPVRLSPEEFAIIKGHPQAGYEILREIDFPWPVAEIVLQHHERLDGSGYPKGLKGDQIRPEARVIAVADVVESMMHYRPYRAPLGLAPALAEIEQGRVRLYDPAAVDACCAVFREDGFRLDPPPIDKPEPDTF
jgi:PAS domain S-box-containing protein/putative nucleotidyltransferase with HDIG domain